MKQRMMIYLLAGLALLCCAGWYFYFTTYAQLDSAIAARNDSDARMLEKNDALLQSEAACDDLRRRLQRAQSDLTLAQADLEIAHKQLQIYQEVMPALVLYDVRITAADANGHTQSKIYRDSATVMVQFRLYDGKENQPLHAAVQLQIQGPDGMALSDGAMALSPTAQGEYYCYFQVSGTLTPGSYYLLVTHGSREAAVRFQVRR